MATSPGPVSHVSAGSEGSSASGTAETHTVDVVEDGFVWRGRRWRSLSEIAREITGARWSGPRFFGSPGEEGRPWLRPRW